MLWKIGRATLINVPVVAKTATATSDTMQFIIGNVCMYNTKMFIATPERTNIKYTVINSASRDPFDLLYPIVQNLTEKGYEADKVLIFCRIVSDVRRIYKCFDIALREKYEDYIKRPFGKCHSKTDEIVKAHIINQFCELRGTIRVLVSRIAFGMGVNIKGLYNIIHFGPPATLDDYFQEAGRAGRDGGQSEAILVIYRKCLNSKHIAKSVKEYAKNKVISRRKLLLSSFNSSSNKFVASLHLCCDICQVKCVCCGNSCHYESNIKLAVNIDQAKSVSPTIQLSETGKELLKKQLLKIREQCLSCSGHCGKDINSGFPLNAVDEIMSIASMDISTEALKLETSVFNESCCEQIIDAVKEIFANHSLTHKENVVSTAGHSIDEN